MGGGGGFFSLLSGGGRGAGGAGPRGDVRAAAVSAAESPRTGWPTRCRRTCRSRVRVAVTDPGHTAPVRGSSRQRRTRRVRPAPPRVARTAGVSVGMGRVYPPVCDSDGRTPGREPAASSRTPTRWRRRRVPYARPGRSTVRSRTWSRSRPQLEEGRPGRWGRADGGGRWGCEPRMGRTVRPPPSRSPGPAVDGRGGVPGVRRGGTAAVSSWCTSRPRTRPSPCNSGPASAWDRPVVVAAFRWCGERVAMVERSGPGG